VSKGPLVCGEDEGPKTQMQGVGYAVQEPARCEYTMEFMTPLACTMEAAQAARAELDQMSVQ
jgi:hypothetical protein